MTCDWYKQREKTTKLFLNFEKWFGPQKIYKNLLLMKNNNRLLERDWNRGIFRHT